MRETPAQIQGRPPYRRGAKRLLLFYPMKKIAIYLDFDNIYGGILQRLNINPKYFNDISFDNELENSFKNLIMDFASKFYESIKSNYEHHIVCFIKAFADFDKIPFAKNFNPSLQTILNNTGITPGNYFVAMGHHFKDAADRALMFEVFEDIFLKKTEIDRVVIGTGDVDFYPLLIFLREHSKLYIDILSFSDRLHKLYKNSFHFKDNILTCDDFFEGVKQKYSKLSQKLLERLKKECLYDDFKEKLISKLKNNNQNRKIKTGLIFKQFLADWKLQISSPVFNKFLEILIKEQCICIIPERQDNPFNGEVKLKNT